MFKMQMRHRSLYRRAIIDLHSVRGCNMTRKVARSQGNACRASPNGADGLGRCYLEEVAAGGLEPPTKGL